MSTIASLTIKILKPIHRFMFQLGFDLKKILFIKNYSKFKKNKKEWISQGGIITKNHMILSDYEDKAGNIKGHYFHQDLLVTNFIYENKPMRHVDVGSRIDGFVAHVASFREIQVVDIRELEKSEHKNIKFVKANFMNDQNLEKTDSISCLHTIEHFGLGRYNDPIDVNGHNKGIANLVSLVKEGGRMYISFPIGQNNEVHFNAHRVFKVDTIFKHPSIKQHMELVRFDYVDDTGNLHSDVMLQDFDTNIKYGCGIYTFKKINDC
jgi:hypothetical protein